MTYFKLNIASEFWSFIVTYILFSIFLFPVFIYAQEEFPPGSPYTAFGIGDLQYSSSIRTEAMGIQGISLFGNDVNNLNPAANSRLNYTIVNFGFRYGFLKSSDGKVISEI